MPMQTHSFCVLPMRAGLLLFRERKMTVCMTCLPELEELMKCQKEDDDMAAMMAEAILSCGSGKQAV
jgi:hypothetical protein